MAALSLYPLDGSILRDEGLSFVGFVEPMLII
jgi:hypothetical protein